MNLERTLDAAHPAVTGACSPKTLGPKTLGPKTVGTM